MRVLRWLCARHEVLTNGPNSSDQWSDTELGSDR